MKLLNSYKTLGLSAPAVLTFLTTNLCLKIQKRSMFWSAIAWARCISTWPFVTASTWVAVLRPKDHTTLVKTANGGAVVRTRAAILRLLAATSH